jgi:HK97 family phage major capsid protein
MMNMPDILKALGELTTTAGGYLTPDEFATQVYKKIVQKAVAPQVLQQVNMSSDVMYFPTVTTGTTAYWTAENVSITTGDFAFGRLTLTAKKVAARLQLSSELMEDANVDVAALVVDQFARDLALEIDKEILRGTGTNFTGFTENTDVNKVTAAATTGDAITLGKIADAVAEIEQDNFMATHMFVHPRTLNVIRKLTDTAGRFIFDEASFGSPLLKEYVVGTVWGLKVIPTNALRTNVTKSTTTTCTDIVVVAEKECGLLGMRRGLQFNKLYNIATDNFDLQANIRNAFTVARPEAVCVIEDIYS